MRKEQRKNYTELFPAPGKVFYNPETGDISEGICVPNSMVEAISSEYQNYELPREEAEQLQIEFIKVWEATIDQEDGDEDEHHIRG